MSVVILLLRHVICQLLDAKYKVMAVQPVDMFPHTHHVENVVLLGEKINYINKKICQEEIEIQAGVL